MKFAIFIECIYNYTMKYCDNIIYTAGLEWIQAAKSHLSSHEYQEKLLHNFLVEERLWKRAIKYARYRNRFLLLCRQKLRKNLYHKRKNKSLYNTPSFEISNKMFDKNMKMEGRYNPFLNRIAVNSEVWEWWKAQKIWFHEMLHASWIINENLSDTEKLKALQLVSLQKIGEMLNYGENEKKHIKSYYFQPEEIITHYKTIAYSEGIAPLAPYPGDENVAEMIARIRIPEDGFIMRLLPDFSPSTLRKVRNALTCRSF